MHKRVSTLIVLTLMLGLQAAFAVELPSLTSPLRAISGIYLEQNEGKTALDFHATLAEPVRYGQWSLPDGTEFIGRVEKESRLRKASHWDVWVEQVHFPNGRTYYMYSGNQKYPQTQLKPMGRQGQQAVLLQPGGPISLRFQPSDMKGMLQMSQLPETTE